MLEIAIRQSQASRSAIFPRVPQLGDFQQPNVLLQTIAS
jgi:hypothetical protein